MPANGTTIFITPLGGSTQI